MKERLRVKEWLAAGRKKADECMKWLYGQRGHIVRFLTVFLVCEAALFFTIGWGVLDFKGGDERRSPSAAGDEDGSYEGRRSVFENLMVWAGESTEKEGDPGIVGEEAAGEDPAVRGGSEAGEDPAVGEGSEAGEDSAVGEGSEAGEDSTVRGGSEAGEDPSGGGGSRSVVPWSSDLQRQKNQPETDGIPADETGEVPVSQDSASEEVGLAETVVDSGLDSGVEETGFVEAEPPL